MICEKHQANFGRALTKAWDRIPVWIVETGTMERTYDYYNDQKANCINWIIFQNLDLISRREDAVLST